jgi:2-C-methyl-D-erythritol 2,4-cyclodiphosphate synthase
LFGIDSSRSAGKNRIQTNSYLVLHLDWFQIVLSPDRPRVGRMVHVGIGYDVHRLVEGRKLILGGVEIPHPKGLEGHSDADVLMHAICDAVLGALGEGDIGHFFPNTDPRWQASPSKVFLQEAARQVSFHDAQIVNLDATLIAEAPKIAPHLHLMKLRISDALGINPRRIGIKATTNEQLGFLGREEGIAAMAVAAIDLPK